MKKEYPSALQQGELLGMQLTEGLHAAVSDSNPCAVSDALGSLYAADARLTIDQVDAHGFTDIALALTDASLLGAVFSNVSISVQYVPSSITASVTGSLKKIGLPNASFRFMQSINFRGVLNSWTIARETLLIVHIPTFSLSKSPSLSDSEKNNQGEEEDEEAGEGMEREEFGNNKEEDEVFDEGKENSFDDMCSENW